MFAPPPPPRLPRAEVERRLAAQKQRAEQAETTASPSRQNAVRKQKNKRQQKAVIRKSSPSRSPPRTQPPRAPPPPAPHERPGDLTSQRRDNVVDRALPKFEEPRAAPLPPKRPPRPPSELFLPPPPEPPRRGRVPVSRPQKVEEESSSQPPPVPAKSPFRQIAALRESDSKSSLSPKPLFSDISSKSVTPTAAKPNLVHSVSGSLISMGSSIRSRSASRQRAQLTEATFNAALASMKARARSDSASSTSSSHSTESSAATRPGLLGRSATAPPTLQRMGGPRSPTKSRQAKRQSIRSLDSHLNSPRVNNAAHVRPAMMIEVDGRKKLKRSDAVKKTGRATVPAAAQKRGRRRRKGETMSMLLDAGFFPVEEIIYAKGQKPKRPPSEWSFRINLPPRLSFIEKDLPQTPSSSITTTPTEVYQTSPTTPRSRRNRRSGASQRSPLSQISENEASPINAGEGDGLRKASEHISPSRLSAIPEDSAAAENPPPRSEVSTPVATQIHLRGGSVITVTPPELTAWQPTIYIHGPIKLPTPQIMPKKNSVASLEPFQEAIDHVYQHALAIPRRRSDDMVVDDMVVDDICDFFDEFGFEMVSFDGDRLSWACSDVDMDELEEMVYEGELERFSTPPPEQPVASPVEVVIAKEILETNSKPAAGSTPPVVVPQVIAPPVENEETLRARGIARLSKSSTGSNNAASERKGSLTLGKEREGGGGGGLPLLPAPEESMLDAVPQPTRGNIGSSSGYASSVQSSRRGGDSTGYATSTHSSRLARDNASVHSGQVSGGEQGFDWDDEVQEIDAGTTWVAPVAAPKPPGVSRGLSSRKTRNPVAKMRRLVATASTIL